MDLKMIRDTILLGLALVLCIAAVVGIVISGGCATTEVSHDQMVRDQLRIDDMHRKSMMLDQLHWMDANNSVDEDRYALFYHLEYDEDPRTGICFAFYKGVPFATVQCGYARDAIPE
jgi:hypothetical protein